MERVWTFSHLALTLRETDFADPALTDPEQAGPAGPPPDVRERGVRLEIRSLEQTGEGSLYSSPALTLGPAVCRVDLLESAPGAADRIHWHPVMHDGEPGARVFDPALSADPEGWLLGGLRDLERLLVGTPAENRQHLVADAGAVADLADEVAGVVSSSLAVLREPWPSGRHDATGMAPVPSRV